MFVHKYFRFITVENMTVDSYEPILQLGDTIYTKAAVFDVTGEVTLQESDTDRRRHFPFSGPCFNFFGGGGSMAFSPSANGAFSGSSDLSYPSSHNPCSAFATPWNGFSQSSDVMFGMGHDHMTPHYMYTTHGDYHDSPGSSMFYWNNMLHMHVHYPQNNPYTNVNIDVHYNITVPFFPTYGIVYNFGTSFRLYPILERFYKAFSVKIKHILVPELSFETLTKQFPSKK